MALLLYLYCFLGGLTSYHFPEDSKLSQKKESVSIYSLKTTSDPNSLRVESWVGASCHIFQLSPFGYIGA